MSDHVVKADDREYSVVITFDPPTGDYTAAIPAFAPLATCGETVEEALEMARDAIELVISYKRDHDEPITVETVPAQVHRVRVSAE